MLEIIKQEFEKLEQIKAIPPVKYLTRREVASLLKITLPTLYDWTKMGWIKSYKIGSRILYKSIEVENSIQNRKFR